MTRSHSHFAVAGLAFLLLAGIARDSTVGPAAQAAGNDAGSRAKYVMHEWGTFTTVAGSDGAQLAGLHREEEALPRFVYAHDGLGTITAKGWARPVENATVKLETPVMYFYADDALTVDVRVGFRGGSISQWYPDRVSGEVPPAPRRASNGGLVGGGIDFARRYDGDIRWRVDVLPPGDHPAWLTWRGDESLTWVSPRRVDANLLRTPSGEHERYLFYRGLGAVEMPVRVSAPADDVVRLANNGSDAVPFLLVFHHRLAVPEDQTRVNPVLGVEFEARVRTAVVRDLGPGETRDVELPAQDATAKWRQSVYRHTSEALQAAGLFEREADAMLQTWWRSYFENDGLRVFWIVPRSLTDRVLPLELDPAPYHAERVLLGRSEVLTPGVEARLVREARRGGDWGSHRFGAAYEARVEALGVDIPGSTE